METSHPERKVCGERRQLVNESRLTTYCVDRPKQTLLIMFTITMLLGFGLPKLHSEFGFRVLVGDGHPSIVALDEFIQNFGGGLPVQIAWECGVGKPCADVFDPVSLEMASKLTRQLEQAQGILSVWGPANAPVFLPTEYGFDVEHFGAGILSNSDTLTEQARSDPFWVNQFISDSEIGRASCRERV